MSTVIFYVQHRNGIPVSLSADKQSDDDIIIPEPLAARFYDGWEELAQWVVSGKELTRRSFLLHRRVQNPVRIHRTNTEIDELDFVVSTNFLQSEVDFFFDPVYAPDVKDVHFFFYSDGVSRKINFSDFDNGHYRLQIPMHRESRFSISDMFRRIVLTENYFSTRYRSKNDFVQYLEERDGYLLLPQSLFHSTVFFIDPNNRDRILGSEFVATQVKWREDVIIVAGAYELRKSKS